MSRAIQRAKVGDVLHLERRSVEIKPLNEYRLIGVYSFGKGIFHRDPKPGIELGNYRYFEVRPGDLVLSNIQAWEGAIAYADEANAGTIGTHRFLTYVPIDGRIDANWARFFFLSDAGFPLIERAAPGSVTRNRTLAIDRFEALEIPLPPIDEQRRVVAQLESLLLRHRQMVAGHRRADALVVHALEGLAHARTAPEVALSELLTLEQDPVPVAPDATYPNVGVLSFGRGLFEKLPIQGASTSASILYRIRAGQFIYSRLFAFEGAYATVDDRFGGYFVSNEFPTFNVDAERLDVRFLQAYFSAPRVWEQLAAGSTGLGVRRQRLKPKHLLEHRLPLPSLTEQQRIGAIAEKFRTVSSLRARTREIASAFEPAAINDAFADLA